MNSYVRFSLAVLLSLIAHFTLLISMLPKERLRPHEQQKVFQVTLQQNTNREQPLAQLAASFSAIRRTEETHKSSLVPTVQMPTTIYLPRAEDRATLGRLQAQSSSMYQQNQIMIAMQQSKMAHERELRKSSILAGLSNLSVTLRPLVTEKIVCLQQTANEIKCTPAQKEETQIILRQFFELALEARNLGIAKNPISMEFGDGTSVSITFLSAP